MLRVPNVNNILGSKQNRNIPAVIKLFIEFYRLARKKRIIIIRHFSQICLINIYTFKLINCCKLYTLKEIFKKLSIW